MGNQIFTYALVVVKKEFLYDEEAILISLKLRCMN